MQQLSCRSTPHAAFVSADAIADLDVVNQRSGLQGPPALPASFFSLARLASLQKLLSPGLGEARRITYVVFPADLPVLLDGVPEGLACVAVQLGAWRLAGRAGRWLTRSFCLILIQEDGIMHAHDRWAARGLFCGVEHAVGALGWSNDQSAETMSRYSRDSAALQKALAAAHGGRLPSVKSIARHCQAGS